MTVRNRGGTLARYSAETTHSVGPAPNSNRKPEIDAETGACGNRDFDAIAVLLADGLPVPRWLPAALPTLVALVAHVRRGEAAARLPGRSDARAKLRRISKLAEELAEALAEKRDGRERDPSVGIFIAGAVRDGRDRAIEEVIALPGEDVPLAARRLREMAGWALQARDSISAEGGPASEAQPASRAGPGRSVPPANVLAAVVVAEVWIVLHGKRPGSQDQTATDAAHAVWAAAGGARAAGAGDQWRRPFLAAMHVHGYWRSTIRAHVCRTGGPVTQSTAE